MNAEPPYTSEKFRPKKNRDTPPALRFKMFNDIDATPSKRCLVDGLLGEGELSAIAGAPGSGKSVLACDVSFHLAAGMDWFGRRVRKPVGVMYVAAERANLTERRFAALRKHYGIASLPLAIVAGCVDFLKNRKHVEEVLTYGDRLTKTTGLPVGLIVVDTVSRALAGGDENGPKDMGTFVSNVASLQDASGAHVMLIHHVPQDGNNRLRGHGALLGAVDTLLTIERAGDARIATLMKDNDGTEGAKHAFRLESVNLSTDEDGFVTSAPIVVCAGEPQIAAPSRRRAPTLPAAAAVALKALDKALDEVGETAPASNHVPPSAKVVMLDTWRSYALQMNISSGEDRAQRQAFSRSVDRLSADGLASTWGLYAWRVDKA